MPFDMTKLFGAEKPVVAMAHLPPLPGTPLYDEVGGPRAIVELIGRTPVGDVVVHPATADHFEEVVAVLGSNPRSPSSASRRVRAIGGAGSRLSFSTV